MRHKPIPSDLFIQNRKRLAALMAPNTLAVVNANDIPPTNADGSLPIVPNSDLFYLSGIEQEETILLLAPHAFDEKLREVLFIRETNELLKIWEGEKHTREEAKKISGIPTVKWLTDFPTVFQTLVCESDGIYLNSNEHKRADVQVQSRDARFILDCKSRFPLHPCHRLAPLMHKLRVVKSPIEIDLMKQAIQITAQGFNKILKLVKPGVMEYEIEAEYARQFIRNRGKFAYTPIIASGKNSNILHYINNDKPCKKGDLLLMDVAASYANYNADLTRTLPVSGKFTRRQKQVYNAVLRVMRATIANASVGKFHRDWQKEAQSIMTDELLSLGLLHKSDVKKQTPDNPACRKYFMHGVGHPLGLDVHDVGLLSDPFAPGWILTVEPGIYIPQEGFGIRLENDILITENGPVDLMSQIPVEPDEIEELMNR